ncbi:MAG: alpha/beta hydrolase [Candidatus Hydrogenedentes bacterium]|nr:alpha/beta hydrolase [Candidatus Hydrogenedentota bacterium]
MDRRKALKQLVVAATACGCAATGGRSRTESRKRPKREVCMETYTFKRVGDCAIKLDVYTGAAAGRLRPIIVAIHGGALIMGARYPIQMDVFSPLLDKGFAVASIDYRLAPETKLPEIIKDVQDAFAWLREQGPDLFGGNPDQIGVQGGSAGGYLTLMTGFCIQPRPKALVSYFGYGDIVGEWYSKPDPFYCTKPMVSKEEAMSAVGQGIPCGNPQGNRRGDFYLYCRQQGIWPNEVVGIDPHTTPDSFVPFCPVKNVTPAYPPTLLAHGTNDTDVPYALSVQMADALQHAGVEHELITLEGAGHGFAHAKPEDYKNVLDRTTAFLLQHLA